MSYSLSRLLSLISPLSHPPFKEIYNQAQYLRYGSTNAGQKKTINSCNFRAYPIINKTRVCINFSTLNIASSVRTVIS